MVIYRDLSFHEFNISSCAHWVFAKYFDHFLENFDFKLLVKYY